MDKKPPRLSPSSALTAPRDDASSATFNLPPLTIPSMTTSATDRAGADAAATASQQARQRQQQQPHQRPPRQDSTHSWDSWYGAEKGTGPGWASLPPSYTSPPPSALDFDASPSSVLLDNYMFRQCVRECKCVTETTSYLEMFSYSDPSYNTIEEHRFSLDEMPSEFENFLKRRGAFAPAQPLPSHHGKFDPGRRLPQGVELVGGVRLVLQLNACDPDTFTPQYISFSHEQYEAMVRSLRLPYRAIESSAVVGPFFWAAMDGHIDDPHLQIVYRKSDVRKKGLTRGWELMLSHSFRTGITTGYAKGTSSSDLEACVQHFKACMGPGAAAQTTTHHPLLLPVIVLSHDLSPAGDARQRRTRDWLRRLENALTMREEILQNEGFVQPSRMIDLDQTNRDLVECHSQVLWKRPQAYREIIENMHRAMRTFWDQSRRERERSLRAATTATTPGTAGNTTWSGNNGPAARITTAPMTATPTSMRKESGGWGSASTVREEMMNWESRMNGGFDSNYDSSSGNNNNHYHCNNHKGYNTESININTSTSTNSSSALPRGFVDRYGVEGGPLHRLHGSIEARLNFYTAKLQGAEHYAHVTLERLTIQRAALYNIIAQKESKLGLQMAADQRRLAHAAKRDSDSMRTLSLLGAVFLPATYLASVFSMVFFNWNGPSAGGGSGSGSGSTSTVSLSSSPSSSSSSSSSSSQGIGLSVSPALWLYFVIAVPLTAAVVVVYKFWDRQRVARYEKEDEDLEKGIEQMEAKIMAKMRDRVMQQARTF